MVDLGQPANTPAEARGLLEVQIWVFLRHKSPVSGYSSVERAAMVAEVPGNP